jgi:hypothetical protein
LKTHNDGGVVKDKQPITIPLVKLGVEATHVATVTILNLHFVIISLRWQDLAIKELEDPISKIFGIC